MFIHIPCSHISNSELCQYMHHTRDINLFHYIPNSPREELIENVRTIQMRDELLKHLEGAQVDVRALRRNCSHYCPFTGGGDIEIFSTAGRYSAVISQEATPKKMHINRKQSEWTTKGLSS